MLAAQGIECRPVWACAGRTRLCQIELFELIMGPVFWRYAFLPEPVVVMLDPALADFERQQVVEEGENLIAAHDLNVKVGLNRGSGIAGLC